MDRDSLKRSLIQGAALALIFLSVAASAGEDGLASRLQSRGARCESVAGGSADLCVFPRVSAGSFNYSEAVAFLVPRGVVKPTEIVVHIQGFRGVCRSSEGVVDTNASPRQTLENFGMIRDFLANATATGVLVFPISKGKNATYHAQLEGRFGAFSEWARTTVGAEKQTAWYLSGHSGAGSVILRSLSNASGSVAFRGLRGIILLDATYGSHGGEWKNLLSKNRAVFMQTAYRSGSATERGSLELRALSQQRPALLLPTSASHCSVPNKFFGSSLKRVLNAAASRK